MIKLPKSWQFIKAIEAAHDTEAVAAVLVDMAKRLGFVSVFGGLLPDQPTRAVDRFMRVLTMVQHFPPEWAERYNQRRYLFHDPILHRLRLDLNPFSWTEAYASCQVESDIKLVGGGAAEFGLRDGFVVPVATLDNQMAAVSFGGDTVDLSPDEAAALAFAVTFAVGHFLKLRSPLGMPSVGLTPRESDCLLWAGEGKTDWEISQILGISRSTVIKHIASAREKLGAVNRTHAIAIAFRLRFLD